ncbi:MAG: hypothetical protein KDH96_06850 [Candidatus Riesia sp.]|nr:hypothetical protein [Candidatus Riesia sp.]
MEESNEKQTFIFDINHKQFLINRMVINIFDAIKESTSFDYDDEELIELVCEKYENLLQVGVSCHDLSYIYRACPGVADKMQLANDIYVLKQSRNDINWDAKKFFTLRAISSIDNVIELAWSNDAVKNETTQFISDKYESLLQVGFNCYDHNYDNYKHYYKVIDTMQWIDCKLANLRSSENDDKESRKSFILETLSDIENAFKNSTPSDYETHIKMIEFICDKYESLIKAGFNCYDYYFDIKYDKISSARRADYLYKNYRFPEDLDENYKNEFMFKMLLEICDMFEKSHKIVSYTKAEKAMSAIFEKYLIMCENGFECYGLKNYCFYPEFFKTMQRIHFLYLCKKCNCSNHYKQIDDEVNAIINEIKTMDYECNDMYEKLVGMNWDKFKHMYRNIRGMDEKYLVIYDKVKTIKMLDDKLKVSFCEIPFEDHCTDAVLNTHQYAESIFHLAVDQYSYKLSKTERCIKLNKIEKLFKVKQEKKNTPQPLTQV